MADETYTFGESETKRIADAVRKIERLPVQRPGPPVPNTGQNTQFLRVTGAGTSFGGLNFFPAKRQEFDRDTAAKSDAADGATLWLINVVGSDLVTDGTGYYKAKQLRDAFDVSGTIRPLFITATDDECTSDIDSFPTMDEQDATANTGFLVTDPTAGTRRILAEDLRKVGYKGEGVTTVTDLGTGTITFSLANSTRQKVVMTGNRTLALSNEYANAEFRLQLIQDGTGNRSPTWFSGIIPAFGVMPPVNPLPDSVTEFGFERLGAGSYRQRGVNYWQS